MEKLVNRYKDGWDDLVEVDMEQMGDLFEYAAVDEGVYMPDFVELFMNSTIRANMDSWHPRYHSECCNELYDHFVECQKHYNKPIARMAVESERDFHCNEFSWIGMWYAFLHYYLDITSKDLYSILPLDKSRKYYTIGHQMSWEGISDRFISDYNEYVSRQGGLI